jgi:tetratricopeptide (TPR) repeat protein
MTEYPLINVCAAQAKVLSALLPLASEPESNEAILPLLDSLVPGVIDICRTGTEALEALRTALFLKKIKKTQAIGQAARQYLPVVLTWLERYRRRCRAAEKAGSGVRQFDELNAAIKDFRKASEEFLLKWPWVNLENLAASRAAYERGEFQDAREALNEILSRNDDPR